MPRPSRFSEIKFCPVGDQLPAGSRNKCFFSRKNPSLFRALDPGFSTPILSSSRWRRPRCIDFARLAIVVANYPPLLPGVQPACSESDIGTAICRAERTLPQLFDNHPAEWVSASVNNHDYRLYHPLLIRNPPQYVGVGSREMTPGLTPRDCWQRSNPTTAIGDQQVVTTCTLVDQP